MIDLTKGELTWPGESIKGAGHVKCSPIKYRRLRAPTETPILWPQMKNWISHDGSLRVRTRGKERDRRFKPERRVCMHKWGGSREKAVGFFLVDPTRDTCRVASSWDWRESADSRWQLEYGLMPYTFQPFKFTFLFPPSSRSLPIRRCRNAVMMSWISEIRFPSFSLWTFLEILSPSN